MSTPNFASIPGVTVGLDAVERVGIEAIHSHVHESTRLTGTWQERLGRTLCLGGAHDGPELALVRVDLEGVDSATRHLEA